MTLQRYIYFLVLFFTTGQLLRFNLPNSVVIHVADVLVALAIIWWIVKELRKKKLAEIAKHRLCKPVSAFLIVAFLSLISSLLLFSFGEVLVGSLYLFRWVIYTGLIFVVSGWTYREKLTLLKMLLLSGSLFIFFGLIQYSLYPNLRNLYYLHWDDHLYRLFSTVLDPNFAASIICLLLFIILPFLFDKSIKKNLKTAGVLLYSTAFIALLLTYSRSGYLMFAIGSTVSLWLLGRKKLIAAMLGLLLIGVLLVPKTPGSAGVELWRMASVMARSISAGQAVKIFIDHPVFGVGFNTYRYAQKQYGFTQNKNWEVSHSGGGTDNSFLFVLATTGVAGFSAYVYLWYNVIRKTTDVYRSSKTLGFEKKMAIIALSAIAGIFVDAMFINSLFYPMIMFWLWLLVGLSS